MTVRQKLFAANSVFKADDVNNYLRDVTTVDAFSELSSLDSGIYVAYVIQERCMFVREGSTWLYAGPSAWSVTVKSASNYNAPINTTGWSDLPGMVQSAYVPRGRTLEVEFKAGIFHVENGFAHLRLVVNGEVVDTATCGGGSVWVPVCLSGSQTGTSTSIVYRAQSFIQAGTGDLRATPEGSVIMRHRYS